MDNQDIQDLHKRIGGIEGSIDSILDHLSVNQFDPDERLTRKDVKHIYKISYVTIHKLMKSGRLPFEKVGRKTLFKRAQVEKILVKSRV